MCLSLQAFLLGMLQGQKLGALGANPLMNLEKQFRFLQSLLRSVMLKVRQLKQESSALPQLSRTLHCQWLPVAASQQHALPKLRQSLQQKQL
jgi:hypothetical protein